jgi:hypothetical protein
LEGCMIRPGQPHGSDYDMGALISPVSDNC